MTTAAASTTGGAPLRSASAIVAVTESGQHLLRIDGYSHTTGAPAGSGIKSSPFRVGGHSWRISYDPSSGHTSSLGYYGVPWYELQQNSISLSLQLDGDAAAEPQDVVRARHSFSLLDREGKRGPYFTDSAGNKTLANWGTPAFINRSELERPEHLHGDSITIRCDVTVMKEIQTKSVDAAQAVPAPPPPPPDLHRDLGGLLATGEAADVAFEVDGKTFVAHRCVLMARSPVLRAELSGLQAAVGGGSVIAVRIEDMEAQDFEALLRYVYTDSLPEEMEEQGRAAAMLPDLVAAANRYGMERLRLLCEAKLRELVDVRTVALLLAFAGEHHCHGLKEACLRFLDDPGNLREVVKVNGLEHLSKSCPSVLKDLIAKLTAPP